MKRTSMRLTALIVTAAVVVGCADGGNDASPPSSSGSGESDGQDDPTEPDGPAELVPVTLGLSAPPNLSHAIYDCVPRVVGFFEEEGLDVTTEILQGSSPALQGLETGVVDVSTIGASALMLARQAGADFLAFHTSVTGNYAYPAVLPDSDIQTLADLEGRTVGVPAAGSGSVPHTQGLVAFEGGDPATIDFLPVGVGVEALSALQNGDVDALAHWDTVYADMEATGAELRYLGSDVADELGFQVVYTATEDWLEENPDVAEGMARAANKAYVFVEENPEAAVRACWQAFPELVPTGVDDETAMANALASLQARLASSGPVDGLYGYSSPEGIEAFIQLQVAAGAVEDGLGPDELWTDEFVRATQDFDEEAVRELARTWTP